MALHEARTLSISIDAPYEAAYDFAHRPESFMQWAAGLATSLHKTRRGWVADTPDGEARVAFTPHNAYGVLDHYVRFPGRPEIHIPLRMICNGSGVEVSLTLLRQPEMTDEMFERDAGLVRADLEALKRLLEGV
ncbi:MAG: polyketide cyclase [Caulobacterales bacterium 68-7]|nr:SRPBCC family protein [Caulobacterales bacterium]OJU10650.1 MAG: polyketide cyclase [Caulobacterales bacterium 68-7]